MRNKIILITFYGCFLFGEYHAQDTLNDNNQVAVFLNHIYHKDILSHPLLKGYQKNFKKYISNPSILNQLRKINFFNLRFKIITGTWCSDSEYAVPRFLKVLKELNIDTSKVEIIGVDFLDNMHKVNPKKIGHDLFAYRLPTFFVFENNNMIGKIVEFPIMTFERDLLKIVSKQYYHPNYSYLDTLSSWLKQGLLSDPNLNIFYLSQYFKKHVNSANVLLSCAKYFYSKKFLFEAVVILRVNQLLFPDNVANLTILGDYYMALEMKLLAFKAYTQAIKLKGETKELIQKLLHITED